MFIYQVNYIVVMCQVHISLSEDGLIATPAAPALQPDGQFPFAVYCAEGFESDSDAFSTAK